MSDAPVWKPATITIDGFRDLINAESAVHNLVSEHIAWMEHELGEMFEDAMGDHPRLRPNRDDFDRIMAPVRRKQRLVAHIQALMPGKRPGRFVREWSCTAEDHPAPFFCRECGARACCCRCP